MNKARRAKVAELLEELDALRLEEEAALYNLPESFQNGAQGERMQEAIDAIDSAIDELRPIAEGSS